MTKTTTLVVNKKFAIDKMEDMTQMAGALKQHIIRHKLYTSIGGKNYVHVDGWSYAGGLMGTYPLVASVENLSTEHEIKWKANVEIVRMTDDKVIGWGFALCSNKEMKKKGFDEYAVLSMAQTRAIGKSYRNLIGWVMKLAGYESTVFEEMPHVEISGKKMVPPQSTNSIPKTSPRSSQKPTVNATLPLECHGCAEPLTQAVYNFSKQRFGIPYCSNCQNLNGK